MNILIATNSNYMLPTSVLLYSLCKQHPNEMIDIYVAYHDLKECDFERMNMIISAFTNKQIHPLDVGPEFASKIKDIDQFSYETYYRILGLDMLPQEVDRILYLDCDMLVTGDIKSVYEEPFTEQCPMKVCHDYIAYRTNIFDYLRKRANVPDSYKYFNAGFLLFNMDYIRKHRSVGYIVDAFYREYNLYPLHDQDILNHMYYDKVEYVPWQLYNMIPGWYYLDTVEFSNGRIRFATYPEIHQGTVRENSRYVEISKQLCENAKIIHFIGFLKPWKYDRKTMYEDLVPFTEKWFKDEEEMYALYPNLELLAHKRE